MTNNELYNKLINCATKETEFDRVVEATDIAAVFDEKNKAIDKLIVRLVANAKTIQDMKEWLDCLYLAMDDKKEEIIKKAEIAKKAIENYKEKNRKKGIEK